MLDKKAKLQIFFLYNQITELYQFDLENIGIMGESAGGHLAMLAAYMDDVELKNPTDIHLKYVVGIFPPSDLQLLLEDQEGLIQGVEIVMAKMPDFLKKRADIKQYLFPFDPEKDSLKTQAFTAKYSPVSYLKSDIPNTLVIHGNQDDIVPISQSNNLEKKMKALQIPLEYHVLEGVNHAFLKATDQQRQQSQDWVLEFVLKHFD